MFRRRVFVILLTSAIALALYAGGPLKHRAAAQAAPQAAQATADAGTPADPLQWSYRIDRYRLAGDSGAARGEIIYYYKCWMCHNQYTKGAPYLKGFVPAFHAGIRAAGWRRHRHRTDQEWRAGHAGVPYQLVRRGRRRRGRVHSRRKVLRRRRESAEESVVPGRGTQVAGAERHIRRRSWNREDSERGHSRRRDDATRRAERRAHHGLHKRRRKFRISQNAGRHVHAVCRRQLR